MRLGFTTVTFRQKSVEEIFALAKENEIDLIEWGGDIHLPYDDPLALEQVLEGQEKFGIRSLSYGSYYKTGEEDFEKFEAICKTAKVTGAKIVRIWLGGRPGALYTQKTFARMIAELEKLCSMAQEYKLTVAAEYHQNTYNDNLKNALRVLESCRAENYKTYWQPQGNEKKDLESLKALLDHIVVVHVFNWSSFNLRYPFCEKPERWQRFFEIISTSKRNIPLIMEFVRGDCPKQFAKDVECIRKMIANI